MVWFNGASLYLPELKHEKLRYRHTYYMVSFAGSGEETEYKFTGKQNLAEMLTETGLIKNGQLDKEAIPVFVAEQEKQVAMTQAFREDMAFRDGLLQHPGYQNYQKKLVERTTTGDVVIEEKKIMVTQASGPVTIAIFRMLETGTDITYHI